MYTVPRLLVERVYNTFKATIEVLVGSLLGSTNLNYVAHKGCVCRAIAYSQKQREFSDTVELTRRKEMVDGVGLNRLWQATENG